jgi:hypothetical protein
MSADPLALQQVEKHMNQLFVIDGVSVRRDFDGRYCLNDLHRAAEVKNVTSLPTGPVLPKRKNSSLKFRALLELQERPRWSPLLVVLTRGHSSARSWFILCNVDQPEI